jgi:hypothetical protein
VKKELIIGAKKLRITITDKDYLASGGEAEIYTQGKQAFKLYFEPAKKMFPPQKMQELSLIVDPQVIIPEDIIYDAKTNKPLGYATRLVTNVDPILKIFNRAYKTANNIDAQQVADLVKKLQKTLTNIHSAKCLAVDFNELNILIELGKEITPWFIDTDSYATPSFKATAIMDSVRDRKATMYDNQGVMHYQPTVVSDWFSWAIITFWIYTNIHPFRGNHKDYRPADKQKQMDDGVSVFQKGVRVPHTVEDFKLIPAKHLDWYKLVFEKGERSIPPLADGITPLLVPAQIVTITGTDKITVEQVAACGSPIIWVQQFMGINYVVTKTGIYSGSDKIRPNDNNKNVVFAPIDGGGMVTAIQSGNTVELAELNTCATIDTLRSHGLFERNGAVYTITNDSMLESSFVLMGSKIINRMKPLENIATQSAKVYPGCIIQDLLGKKYLTIPYALGRSFSKYLPGLDSVRIIDAKSDKTVTVLIGETKGKYNRYIVVFDKRYQNFEIRVEENVAYEPVNFAVLENGLCGMLAGDVLELFSTAQTFETLDNPPFDASMPMFATPKGFFIINGNTIHQIKRK